MVLKVGTFYSNKPDSWPCAEKNLTVRENCPKPGFINEVFTFAAGMAGIDYEIIPLGKGTKIGNFQNCKWTLAYGKMAEGVLDFLMSPFIETQLDGLPSNFHILSTKAELRF